MFIALLFCKTKDKTFKKLSLADVCTYISHGSVSSQPVHPYWGLKRSSGYVVQPPLVKDALYQLKNIKPTPMAFHNLDWVLWFVLILKPFSTLLWIFSILLKMLAPNLSLTLQDWSLLCHRPGLRSLLIFFFFVHCMYWKYEFWEFFQLLDINGSCRSKQSLCRQKSEITFQVAFLLT